MLDGRAPEVTFDDRLMEWSAGDWSGECYTDLPERWPAEWTAWQRDPLTCASPGGESFLDLRDRARAFVDEGPIPGVPMARRPATESA